MPRKQRFKPSRKPKPNPQNEDAMIGRPTNGAPVYKDNIDAPDAIPSRDEGSSTEPSSEPRSH